MSRVGKLQGEILLWAAKASLSKIPKKTPGMKSEPLPTKVDFGGTSGTCMRNEERRGFALVST